MRTTTHLSTDELLLRSDNELAAERLSHLQECAPCQAALADLISLLDVAAGDLRASLPPESEADRAASRMTLERELTVRVRAARPPVIPFPVWRVAGYAAAAMIGFAVFSGYLFNGVEVAPNQNAEQVAETWTLPAPVVAKEPVVAEGATPALQRPAAEPEPGEIATLAQAQRPARFEMAAAVVSRPASEAIIGAIPGAISGVKTPVVAAGAEIEPLERKILGPESIFALLQPRTPELPVATLPVAELPVAELPVRRTPEIRPDLLVAGHWILHRAGVWREDLSPAVSETGLVLRGSAENAAVRERILAAIRKTPAGREVPVELTLRSAGPAAAALADVVRVGDHAAGGAVRNSLLAHFSDAARRSFVAPLPAVLESELRRYISDVFTGQSDLLAHAYALKTILHSVSGDGLSELNPAASRHLAEMARFHLREVRENRERIYDLLSETLPRKYWTYRPAAQAADSPNSPLEAQALLDDVLALDETLTALLSTGAFFVNASDADLSCGALLQRIENHTRRLHAGLKVLK